MDEKTNVQDVDVQDEVFDMNEPDVDMADFDAEDEEFDMEMAASNIANEYFEKQQNEEMEQMNERVEKMAAKFPGDFVLTPPEDVNKRNSILKTQLAKKARRKA